MSLVIPLALDTLDFAGWNQITLPGQAAGDDLHESALDPASAAQLAHLTRVLAELAERPLSEWRVRFSNMASMAGLKICCLWEDC